MNKDYVAELDLLIKDALYEIETAVNDHDIDCNKECISITIPEKCSRNLVEVEKIIKELGSVYIIGKCNERIFVDRYNLNDYDICSLANKLKDVNRVRGTYYGGLPRYK